MKKNVFFFFLCFALTKNFAQVPKSFLSHRVKKEETLDQIIKKYDIKESQLLEYNPFLKKTGIKKKLVLRIPVYNQNKELKLVEKNIPSHTYNIHKVNPKETKWRLAYKYGMTIRELDSLNPILVNGLKIGQEIRVRNTLLLDSIPEKDTLYNYYSVQPSEGFYRIEKKLGINRSNLEALNPKLKETGLQVGMVLKIPELLTGELKIENDLLVERINLIDSMLTKKKIKFGVLLPFKSNEIIFDSIEDTKRILEERNLHTVSLDFYSGVLFAVDKLINKGLEIDLFNYDTQNNLTQIKEIIESKELESLDFILGPLIPSNFDYLSGNNSLKNIPKISPLSTNPIEYRKNVFQSVTQESFFRNKMYQYLEKKLDTTHHIVIVADEKNRDIENELQSRFPWSIKLRPEKSDYIIPELVDSLLLDSIENKIILETQSFPLIASAISQFNSQNTENRNVQVYTTYRGNAYNNDNLSRKALGGIKLTYPSGFKPFYKTFDEDYVKSFIDKFGKYPNIEALRGYDVTMDAILRTAFVKNLTKSIELGETQYEANRFLYEENDNESYSNKAYYILEHNDYDIFELKE
ncbi:MAG: LysM peptidoglycan-binding domain-containing protein [Flavobacteriaceae bacterium]